MPSPTPAPQFDVSPALRSVHALHAEINRLRAREAECTAEIERASREREEVREALAETQAELETAVLAPVPGGVDPTETLPDEILWMILVRVLAGGTCGWVCRRWHAVCAGATAKKQAWQWRWARPLRDIMELHELGSCCMAVGLDGKLYGGHCEHTISVWSTVTNTHLQTLRGHTGPLRALVVGKDGVVYSASADSTVRIWSGEDGSPLHTLERHTHPVTCLAVGSDGTVYSGSEDTTICVWSHGRGESRLIHTLEGHDDTVRSLALSNSCTLYSASEDTTIQVWSTVDGSHVGTLLGHTELVNAVAVGADGTVYSGSNDSTLRTWSGLDGSPIRTLQMSHAVLVIVIGAGNTVITGCGAQLSTCNGGAAPVRTLGSFRKHMKTRVKAMAIGQDGHLFVAWLW
jgi:WD40 repeat protein